jgi:adenine phosphoribosyltransferase
MKDYLRLIDTHTQGKRCDVTPLFADPQAFAALVADLAAPFQSMPLDYVAGIEALGFILGTALSLRLGKGFIPIRKAGKLPVAAARVRFVDYSGQEKALELRHGLLPAGARVLLVDEWVETGAQVGAAIALIENQGAVVVGVAAINIDSNPLPDRLREKYFCHAIWMDMQESI